MNRTRLRIRSLMVLGSAAGLALLARPSEALVTPTCPQTSTPTVWNGSYLDANTTKNGTVYNSNGTGTLELARTGATFNVKQMTSTSDTVYATVADFNKDGWQDFVGTPENKANSALTLFQNFTWQNENCTTVACTTYSGAGIPNWNDPTVVITPKFTGVRNLHSGNFNGQYALAAGDFNGDGWDDVFEAYAPSSGTPNNPITTFNMYTNKAVNDASGYAQFNAAYAAQSGFTITNVIGNQTWSGTNAVAVDYNKDGKLDVVLGSGASGGSIRILLNNCPGSFVSGVFKCSSNPKFTDGGYLKNNLNTNNSGFGTNVSGANPSFGYADVDGDGLKDLIIGAPNCCSQANYRLRLFKGCSGGTGCTAGLENTASQSLTFGGAATGVFIADYSLDGKPDLIVATDGKNYNASTNGGTTFYWKNNGTSTPFSDASTQLTFRGSPVSDYDVGFVFDYDRDPTHSPDVMVADGNDSAGYYVLADRLSPKYVDCGDAFSGVVDLGALLTSEMVVTAARITPTFTLNGGTITFYMSNEEPPNWVQASLCAGSSTDYCVSFPKPVGRTVRWKANMCSNAAHTATPTLTTMNAKFDYTEAKEHYRSGVVVNDGVAYVGALHQPGDRGRFYAINTGLTSVYWDGAVKLDALADSQRKIYTSLPNLPVRYDFTTANASDPLIQNLLTTPDVQDTTDLITWVRSARFGVGNPTIPLTKLGSIETSTPSILSKPGRPNWYSYVTGIERTRIEAFIAANATRQPLVMFGAKDAMLHALFTKPTAIADPINGKEAWAYIPPTVASGLLEDYTNTTIANQTAGDGTNHPQMTSYPDGSPTLVDYHQGGGVMKTAAIVAEGNGGKAISVLDVTQTVDPVTLAVTGPQPLWSATPGNGEAGQAYAKPAVARVLINNAERYLVIAGTGVDYTDTQDQKGRVISAYDLLNGVLLWKFQTKCPLTSDITVFETDDITEPGAPTLNGYADRVVFADKCGYVYKLAPGVDKAGGWYQNTGMGTIAANTAPDGSIQYALFSTKLTSGGLGQDRPIAGTVAARTDSSTRMVLFFGTGGIETVASTAQNAFYAVYADTGLIRSKVNGACVSGQCEKFYGGTVVTPEQVIFTRTIDPVIGTNACDPGSSTIQAMQLNPNAIGDFVSDFTLAVSSAVMGSLYGDAGAIYFATLSGDVARVGTPRTPSAGGDTSAGVGQGMGVGDQGTGAATVGTTSPFTLIGWRVVL